MSPSSPESHSESVTPIPIIFGFAFWLVTYSAKVLPRVIRIAPDYFEENARDFQLPMGLTLEEVHLVVLIYIPSITRFFLSLGLLIFYLWVPILASTSLLPSVIQYHTGRFVGAVERCASLRPLLSPWQYSFKPQSLPKTSYRPDNIPFGRIRTAPSACELARLDLSLRLFVRSNRPKTGQISQHNVALPRCGSSADICLDYCCCWHTWKDQMVALKRSPVSFSSSLA
jgi:hypothetical protein